MLTLNSNNNSAPLTDQEEKEVIEILKNTVLLTTCDGTVYHGFSQFIPLQKFLDNYARMKEREEGMRKVKKEPDTICNRCKEKRIMCSDNLCEDCWIDIHGR